MSLEHLGFIADDSILVIPTILLMEQRCSAKVKYLNWNRRGKEVHGVNGEE